MGMHALSLAQNIHIYTCVQNTHSHTFTYTTQSYKLKATELILTYPLILWMISRIEMGKINEI